MASDNLFAPAPTSAVPPASQTPATVPSVPAAPAAPSIPTSVPAGPPLRPPPPQMAQGAPAPTSSPAKSALDDLNDSIRMALGGSPAHIPPQPQPPPQQQQQLPQQPLQQPVFNAFDFGGGQSAPGFVPVVGYPGSVPGFGSPAKQNVTVTGRESGTTGVQSG